MIPLGLYGAARPSAVVGYAAEVLADSPLGYWRLGEASGTTAADSSGNGRSGTYSGTYTLGATGAVPDDTAVTFTAGEARIADAAWMDCANITVEALIKLTATGVRMIASRDRDLGTDRSFWFYIEDGVLKAGLWGPAGANTFFAAATPTVHNGAWHHVALTCDSTTARLFIDGTQRGSTSFGAIQSIAWPITFGSHMPSTGRNYAFTGDLDEVAYYGTALSAARILAHAQAAGVA